jgi:hypothetical protein
MASGFMELGVKCGKGVEVSKFTIGIWITPSARKQAMIGLP